ncbi:MAG: leucine-rich repeat domain-containing protein [Prevotella sp.]|nr:leucine-rich repeat domain-containing protein [Prevotella sp.]
MKRLSVILFLSAVNCLLLFARIPDIPDFSDDNGWMYKFYRDDINGHRLEGHDDEVIFWGLSDRDPEGNKRFENLKVLRIPATVRPSKNDHTGIVFFEGEPPLFRVTGVSSHAFNDFPALEEIVLPEGIVDIDPFAMSGIPAKRINIPASMKHVYPGLFRGYDDKWEAVTVAKSNPRYSSRDGLLYSKQQDTLWVCPQAHRGDVTLPATVKVVYEDAFNRATNIGRVTLPEGVVSIGKSAFYDSSITQVNIPGSLKTLPKNVLGQCKQLKQVVIDEGVEVIGEGAFSCSYLETVTLPSTIRELGDEAFMLCDKVHDAYCKVLEPLSINMGKDCFRFVDLSKITLHVPAEAVDTYRALCQGMFADIVAM